MAYQRIHQFSSRNAPIQKSTGQFSPQSVVMPPQQETERLTPQDESLDAWTGRLNGAAQPGHHLANLSIQPASHTDHGAPAAGSNQTGLPGHLKAGIESLSGLSVDGVRVHYNSARPAQLQAHAFAWRNEIHVARGQEQHLPHEAWHIVQQAAGRVKPTVQMGNGVSINDDAGLETEAEAMGAAALRAGEEGHHRVGHSYAHMPATGFQADAAPGSGPGSAPPAQLFGFSTLTQYLPGLPETWKETIDPRRWMMNPYWRHFNQDERNYEATHQPLLPGPGGYHSRERHGAEHTLENIHARTQQAAPLFGPLPFTGPIPAVGNLPATGPSAMIHEGHQVRGYVAGGAPLASGRFATPAWHTYSRNVAIAHASLHLPAGVAWPASAPPGGIPGGNYHRFTTHYQGSPAGLSVQAAGPQTATPAHFVLTGVQYNPGTNQAWIVQHFPQTAAVAAGLLIPNNIVPYDQIPWLSTQA